MEIKHFDDALGLTVDCEHVTSDGATLLILGDRAAALAQSLSQGRALGRQTGPARLLFGLPFYTAPYPVFVGALSTEKNTVFDTLALFGWIEDNAIYEPRAEVFGITPLRERPIMFLRDFDLDRPVEIWMQAPAPAGWLRIAGAVVASARYASEPQALTGEDAALIALEHAAPAGALPLIEALRMDVARGTPLKAALRARRRGENAANMALCDGWRVISQAVPLIRLNPDAAPGASFDALPKLAGKRVW